MNDRIRITTTQPVLSKGKWVEMGVLHVGDTLTAADGTPLPIVSLRTVNEKTTVYNLQVGLVNTYIASGIIVHNKCLLEQYYPPGNP